MTFPTHRAFAIGWVLVGNMILFYLGMTEINYYLALVIMLQIGKYGALFPDIDHSWHNVKEKTVPNWIINKLIHLTGGKHRSWQTHSLDITLLVAIASYTVPGLLSDRGIISNVNKEVLSIIMIAFSLGWLSHIFSDMLTSSGSWIMLLGKKKVVLVPKKLFGIVFNTGNEWEDFVFRTTKMVNIVIGLFAVVFPLLFTEQGVRLIGSIKNMIN